MFQSPGHNAADTLTRRATLLTVAIVALAAVLRTPDLFGWWTNPDEGIYFGIVTRDGFGGAWTEAMGTAHPPLYFLLLRAVGWISTDFAALRAVAFVSGLAAVWLLVPLGREIGGPGAHGHVAGLTAALLLALSPRAVVLSQVIRPYMLLVLLLAGSLLFLLRYLRTGSSAHLVAHASCSVLAALLHYGAVFGLAVLGAAVLVDGWRGGTHRPAWRRLLAVQALPAALLATLYFVHLRHVAAGPLGDHALEGWLAPYMATGPRSAWFGFVGFHAMLVGDAFAAPAALLTLAALGYVAWRAPEQPVLVMAAAGLLVALAGAALQLYPFGPTRHSAWLLVFVIPLWGWATGSLLTSGRTVLLRGTATVATVALAGLALAPVLDPSERPEETTEHVLREAAVEAMAEVLDPSSDPRVVLMSTDTYELLTPLYTAPRQRAERSADGRFLHFRWGVRDVVVLAARDFVVGADQLGRVDHLYTAATVAQVEFGVAMPPPGRPVLVLAGGWRWRGMNDLAELARRTGPLGTTTSVPGLVALQLDLAAFGRAIGAPSL
jgi:hypothetical protein